MTDPIALLRSDAPDGARVLALDWLDRLRASRRALLDAPEDPETVHAARVAITRLRATLRHYQPVLGPGIGRRGARLLQRTNAALGRVRDRDVSAEQLRAASDTFSAEAQAGAAWLAARLTAERAHRMHRAMRVVGADLEQTLDDWQDRLTHYKERREAGVSRTAQPLAALVVQGLHSDVERLQGAMQTVRHRREVESLHRLRIESKRLRARLVPWLPALPALTPLFASATSLQDGLGVARDAHLLERRAQRAATQHPEDSSEHLALLALAEACAHSAASQTQHMLDSWCVDAPESPFAKLLAHVSRASDALAGVAREGHEIERKYLLHALPERLHDVEGIRIAQGWLPGERLRERLRRSVHPDGRVEWTRTVKVGAGVTRLEVEEAASPMLFESLWPLTAAERVEKVRHAIVEGAFTWEIDVFLDRELLLAEIELPSVETPVTFPEWLAPCVEREVTGDPAYVNANLARVPRPAPPK